MDIEKPMASKPKFNLLQNTAYMIGVAWGTYKSVLVLLVTGVLMAVAASLLNLFVAPTILGAVEAGVPVWQLVRTILLFVLGMMVTSAATRYIGGNQFYTCFGVRTEMMVRIHERFMTMSYPMTERQSLRKTLEKAEVAVQRYEGAAHKIWEQLESFLTNCAGLAIYLVMLVAVDPILLAVVLGTTLAAFFVNRFFARLEYQLRDQEADASRRMMYYLRKTEDYSLAKDVRLFGMRGWLEDTFNSALSFYRRHVVGRCERRYFWGDLVGLALTFLRNGAAYAYLIALVLDGKLTAAQFLLYFSAAGGFAVWMTGILDGLSALRKQSFDISAYREFMAYEDDFQFDDGNPLAAEIDKPYEIKLENVSFRYPETETDILSNINLTIAPFEKLAVVGLNGAGKTTLVKLICGFLDPTEGTVLLNGVDIRTYNRRDYYKMFSAVFQEVSLLALSVADNISQTVDNADMARVRACSGKANLTQKIDSLQNGYETRLGREIDEDGVDLSGGEVQKLLLARALYKNAPFIVLDEPTAALDPIAESEMYGKYNELANARTAVYISHRLASTRFCDRVILLDENHIAEEGTHESLLAQNGKYAELFEIQSRYYREGGLADA